MIKQAEKKIKLSQIAYVTQGQSPESKYYSDKDGVPFLQGNRTFGNLYPHYDTFTQKVTKLAKAGEVLMSIRAPVGDLNIAPSDLCIGRGLASLKALDGDNNFVYYALKYNVKNLIKKGGATTFDSVNKDIINDFELIIPSNKEMRGKVSKILTDIDSKIELNDKINSKLEEIAVTLYDYWFIQFDFPDENGKPYKSNGGEMIWNDDLKQLIPKGWESGKLKDIVNNIKSSIDNSNKKSLPYIPIDDLPKKKLISATSRNNSEAQSSLLLFKKYDILLGAMRVYFHRVCLAIQDGITRSTTFVLRAKSENYIYYALFTIYKNEAIEFATKNSKGSTMPYTFWEGGLDNYPIIKPEGTILENFNKIIFPLLEKSTINEKEKNKLSELRDWLLPMLMNGQVTVE